MDEPTSALTTDEAARLFELIRRLRDRGATVVYVSHFLPEVLSLADAVTVLRDGRLVRTAPAHEETPERLVSAMLGRSLDLAFPAKVPAPADAPVVLSVRGLSRPPAVQDVSFELRAGEIVGLAGLIGSGRSEVARTIFGADRAAAGVIELDGRPISPRSPRAAIRNGIAMLPEDRKRQGLLMEAVPGARRMAALFDSRVTRANHLTALQEAARARGAALEVFGVAWPEDIVAAINAASASGAEAINFLATSLFSVLGDFPSTSAGGTIRWRAAPRLELLGTGAGLQAGGELSPQAGGLQRPAGQLGGQMG